MLLPTDDWPDELKPLRTFCDPSKLRLRCLVSHDGLSAVSQWRLEGKPAEPLLIHRTMTTLLAVGKFFERWGPFLPGEGDMILVDVLVWWTNQKGIVVGLLGMLGALVEGAQWCLIDMDTSERHLSFYSEAGRVIRVLIPFDSLVSL